ncbi:MAG: T9SS type A sorting domain-containing protein [Bacteroidales bacterium]
MKTRIAILLLLAAGIILFESFYNPDPKSKEDQYIVIGWNDLGMHCSNQDFSKIAVLPPYNNLMAQVIKKGSESTSPELVTSGFVVTYEVPGNTYSVGKTNFWDYEDQLFGVNLLDNIGLTGVGLSGEMVAEDGFFKVEGVPLTPYTDNNLNVEDPYQLALLQAYDSENLVIASTQPVIPVSNEINCVSSGCHSSENDILYEHEDEGGFDPTDTPILCAECHSSNALGTPGTPGLESLSQVIHEKHGEETNDCYKCHPGPNTQCHRGIMNQLGMVCQDCHGSVEEVGQSIDDGREPWLEEPSCGAVECHGPDYAEEPGKLFRQSRGHGGLYCSACHGSPHAIYPGNERDNIQNIALQGYAGILQECEVCHGVNPSGPGPHGIMATDIKEIDKSVSGSSFIDQIYPNPASGLTYVAFNLDEPAKVNIDVFTISGKKVYTLVKNRLASGKYLAELDASAFGQGVYW